jgi:protein-tyrosine-phosphatase
MAEALFNHLAKNKHEDDRWIARSAGTWALQNEPASGHAQTVMAQRGIDLRAHRGHTITQDDLADAAVVVVMTRSHRDALTAQFPEHAHRIYLLSQVAGQTYDIGDPYGGVLAEYESCARQLQTLLENGYEQIKAWAFNEHP